jgi:hypothetical protein
MISALLNWKDETNRRPFSCAFLGRHHWGRYFVQDKYFIELFAEYDGAISRTCDKCGRMEITFDEGKNWKHRN